MVFPLDYEAFLKDPGLCYSADSLGQSAILQTEIRLARASWQQDSG